MNGSHGETTVKGSERRHSIEELTCSFIFHNKWGDFFPPSAQPHVRRIGSKLDPNTICSTFHTVPGRDNWKKAPLWKTLMQLVQSTDAFSHFPTPPTPTFFISGSSNYIAIRAFHQMCQYSLPTLITAPESGRTTNKWPSLSINFPASMIAQHWPPAKEGAANK